MPANNIHNNITTTATEKQQTGYFKFRVNNQPVSRPKINTSEKRLRDLASTLPKPGDSFRNRLNNVSKTQTQKGIGTYRQNNKSSRSARNNIRRGADLYLKAGPELMNNSSLFARNTYNQSPLNTLANRISTNINQGITQYQGLNSSRRNVSNLLPGGSDMFLRSRPVSSNTGTTSTFMNSSLIKNAISQYRASNESPQSNNFLSSTADIYLKTGMNRLQKTTLFQYS